MATKFSSFFQEAVEDSANVEESSDKIIRLLSQFVRHVSIDNETFPAALRTLSFMNSYLEDVRKYFDELNIHYNAIKNFEGRLRQNIMAFLHEPVELPPTHRLIK